MKTLRFKGAIIEIRKSLVSAASKKVGYGYEISEPNDFGPGVQSYKFWATEKMALKKAKEHINEILKEEKKSKKVKFGF